MRSLISIPAYLLKNTLHRWLENPASPATKVLVPFLFAALGLFFFGLLHQVENRLSAQLNRADLRAIRAEEVLFSDAAKERLALGTNESALWADYCESYHAFQQAPLLAALGNTRRLPVLSYDVPPPFFSVPETAPGEDRPILLLTNRKPPGQHVTLEVIDQKIAALTAPLDPLLEKSYQKPAIAVFPIEFLELPLQRGFTQIQILVPRADLSTAELARLLANHAQAENRSLRVETSLDVIQGLDRLLTQQQQARFAIGTLLTLIVSLTLGSLSLLEFRQESYLIALMRSFGIRPLNLLTHYLLETSLLTFSGIFLAYLLYQKTAQSPAGLKIPYLSHTLPELLGQVSPADLNALLIAAGIGVLLSAFPIALGLRKQPGLLLP
ncbi:MAG: hypothetical protein ACQKBY_06840 [Verrucomicrobiales bacterium]